MSDLQASARIEADVTHEVRTADGKIHTFITHSHKDPLKHRLCNLVGHNRRVELFQIRPFNRRQKRLRSE